VPVHGSVEAFVGVGRTTRLPDPQERFFALRRMGSDWVGNPGLQPTANTEVDAGFSYRGRRVTLRPTLFYSSVSNMITVHNQPRIAPVPGVANEAARSFDNTDAHLYGGELSASVEITRALLVSAGTAWSRGQKDTNPELRILDPHIAEVPPLRGRAGVRYGSRRFYTEAEWAGSWRQTLVDSDLQEAPTPGYGLVNLKAGIRTDPVKLSVGIDNLLDRYYYEHTSYQRDPFRIGARIPEPGRSFFVAAAYSF
jgi:iron complex outermembrane receptor protein